MDNQIQQNIDRIRTAKADMVSSLNAKGVDVSNEETVDKFADKIKALKLVGKHKDGGEIFNDYDKNQSIGIFSHSEGSTVQYSKEMELEVLYDAKVGDELIVVKGPAILPYTVKTENFGYTATVNQEAFYIAEGCAFSVDGEEYTIRRAKDNGNSGNVYIYLYDKVRIKINKGVYKFIFKPLFNIDEGSLGDFSHKESLAFSASGYGSHSENGLYFRSLLEEGVGNISNGVITLDYRNESQNPSYQKLSGTIGRDDWVVIGDTRNGNCGTLLFAVINGTPYPISKISFTRPSPVPEIAFKFTLENIDTNISKDIVFNIGYFSILSTMAMGVFSHSEGGGNISCGYGSHSEGGLTLSYGDYSHSEGGVTYKSTIKNEPSGRLTPCKFKATNSSNEIMAIDSHPTTDNGIEVITSCFVINKQIYRIIGEHEDSLYNSWYTIDRPFDSDSGEYVGYHIGFPDLVSASLGNASHSEGTFTYAIGEASHSEGGMTTAFGDFSHSGGLGTRADNFCQVSLGIYNKQDETPSFKEFKKEKPAFVIGNGSAVLNRNDAFRVLFNGTVEADGQYTTPAADYAENFEWVDGNPSGEDRVGYIVAMDGEKIKMADEGDYLVGIVSAAPAIVGDEPMDWHGKYMVDEWGRPVYGWADVEYTETEYQDVEEQVEYTDMEKQPDGTFREVVKTRTETVNRPVEVKKTRQEYRRALNPEYDGSQEYIERKNRKEWSAIGMLGKLLVRQDGTLKAGGFCKPSKGIATSSDKGYYVMKVVNDKQALVLVR